MNQTYAYSRYDRKIKFRMVSAQHFINEAPDVIVLTFKSGLLMYRTLYILSSRQNQRFFHTAQTPGDMKTIQNQFRKRVG